MSKNLIKNKSFDVLIVEDEPILALALEKKLKKIGLNISGIAQNYDKAMLITLNKYPDLAIIDINLNSKKTGIDIANYLWKNYNIPIIFLTSYFNDKILNQAMDAEPYAYLIKPCKEEDLKVAINTTVHKHHYFFKEKQKLNIDENEYIFLEENIKYEKVNGNLYINEEIYSLTKNEKKLFEILCKDPGKVISFSTIFNFIWREDVYDLSKLRSLIYRLKNKIGINPFENLYEEGYRVRAIEKNF